MNSSDCPRSQQNETPRAKVLKPLKIELSTHSEMSSETATPTTFATQRPLSKQAAVALRSASAAKRIVMIIDAR